MFSGHSIGHICDVIFLIHKTLITTTINNTVLSMEMEWMGVSVTIRKNPCQKNRLLTPELHFIHRVDLRIILTIYCNPDVQLQK